ncbi:MAG: hypothetical protein KGL39_15675 [Patescibacteria group bacterium]|nr:hypothetical protein [Patescibacteria group bacterium]
MKFTKNCLLKICLLPALLLGLPLAARAQNFQSESFINGSNLLVTVGNPVTYGSSNLVYAAGSMQTNSGTYPYVSSWAPIWHTNASGIQDCGLWANRDGSAAVASISADVSGIAGGTNTLTFNFAVVPHGSRAATLAQNLWSFSFKKDDNVDDIVATNLPAGLLQGCAGLRLLSIVPTGVSGNTNYTVNAIRLNGFHPVQ